jgi:hypothetical protein
VVRGTVHTSVVDQHRVDANPDPHPNFHVDAVPDTDRDRHQNDARPFSCGCYPSFAHVGKSEFFYLPLVTALQVKLFYCIFLISVKDVII